MSATVDALKQKIAALAERERTFADPSSPPAQDVTLRKMAAMEQLKALTPEPEPTLPSVEDAVCRARKRSGLESVRHGLQERLARVPEGSASADVILNDLVAVRAGLDALDAEEGGA